MPKPFGYLLPPGDAYTEELCCALVFYPDKDEYRRALLGAVTHFGTWLAWETDSAKRGKDAARAWKDANSRTLECWNMACLDELIADMAAVRALLERHKDCCDDGLTYGLQDEVETDITPFVGDPPEFYGETAVTDWDDWAEHVCYNAHLYVDNLINMGSQLEGAVSQSALYIGLIAAGLVALSFIGIGLPVAYLLAATVLSTLIYNVTALTFATTADDLEDARDLIVCALINGGDLATVVADALSSDASWDLFYQFVDYSSASAIIHEGGAIGEFLPADTRDDCDCEEGPEHELFWTWLTDIEEPWRLTGDAYWADGSVVMGGNATLQAWCGEMREYVSLPVAGTIAISRLKINYKRSTTSSAAYVRIIHDGGTWNFVYDDLPANNWYQREFFFDPPLEVTHPLNPFIKFDGGASVNIIRNAWVELDFDDV